MYSNPLFSVLIANYNNTLYLMDAINSIYAQTYENWEIIIVDDFSTDNAKVIYDELTKDTRIRVFYNNNNLGCGYTKRNCVDETRGGICGFLDPDDTLTPDALEKMVIAHNQNPDCSLIHSKFYFCDENLNRTSVYENGENVKAGNNEFFNMNGEISHFVSFKKSFYNTTEGIDPFLIRAVDQDLYLKLYEAGRTLYVDDALYNYRIHDGGISLNKNARKAYYWKWVVIMSTIKRRKLNFENSFFDYFIPRHEYDEILKKYNRFRTIDKYLNRLKRIFSK